MFRASGLRPFVLDAGALLAGVGVLIVLCLLSLAVGSRPLGLAEAWEGLHAHDDTIASLIVWRLRLPRTALAIVTGAALAVAGAVMQALTRNPLAEPGILGVNAGASLAVVLSVWLGGITTVSGYLWFAFAGAALAATLVQLMARRSRDAGPVRLVLAGIALGASLNAITGTITMYDTSAFDSYRFWVVGALEGRDATMLAWVAPFLAAGLVLALASGHALNVLALGEEQATALGARLGRVRALALVSITLLCGAATAAVGPISFIGLVVPHVLRLVLGVDQRRLLAASVLAGPILLLTADIVGRVLIRPDEMEAGVVTAFIGGPVLLAMVLRRREAIR
ncbi:iron ABC transporter permease [Actinomyces sp.]|uniref:FecCD family ABC transporter permease n=1 Tax=Actinomyces sp. TaxID=29317 RepID=UPI0026DCD123|nr:iron chelate uptake ABC transporter family permease subunit [Actinomyces sp.]MDO4901507.1 iron chelate uptake ABC transporter family permease subunit [Actinomyces sp.]